MLAIRRFAALFIFLSFISFSSRPAAAAVTDISGSAASIVTQSVPRAAFVVTSLADTASPGTLRDVITQANALAGADTITFQNGLTGTITLSADLPHVTDALTIIGPGADKITLTGATTRTGFRTHANTGSLSISGLTLNAMNTGINSRTGTALTLSDMVFSSMMSRAISFSDSSLTMTRITVKDNIGRRAINPVNATVTMIDSTITGSKKNAMEIEGGSATITGSTFDNNSGETAGDIYAFNTAVVNITNSTFSGSVSENPNYGTAIHAYSGATITIQFSTFSGHSSSTATRQAGILAADNATITLNASIIANNPAGGTPRECTAVNGATFTGSGNRTADTGCAGRIGAPSNVSASLADNGGPTRTHALLSGSNAIDAYTGAACPVTDQRGLPRPAVSASCDLGAFEFGAVIPVLTPDINLTGSGVTIASGDTTPSAADHTDFGITLLGSPLTRTFTIENTGTGTLNIASITLPSGFSQAAPLPLLTLATGSSTALNLDCDAAAAGSFTGTVSIENDDPDENPYSFDIACQVDTPVPAGITLTGDGGAAVSEAGDTHAYTLALDSLPTAAVTITLTFDGQITVNGSASPLILTFTDLTPQTLTVAALNDAQVEGPHSTAISYAVTSADPNYYGFSLADSVVAITDNDAASITFGSPAGSISEASMPFVNAVLTITSDPAGGTLALPVTVAILQTPDTAATPDDYLLTTTSLSFPANSVSGAVQPISVSITDDALDEPDETFTLSFGALTGPADASGTHAVTILDDDSAGITLTGDGGAAVSEAGATHPYTIALDSLPTAAVTITLTFDGQITVNGSASPLILTFTDMTPQTLTVAALNDSSVEGPHSAAISYAVASADSNYHAFSLADSVVAITDNDAASITFGSPAGSISEVSTPYMINAVLTITSDPAGGALAVPVTVALIHTPDSAATPDDYLLTTTSLSFPANSVSGAVQPISVSITNDALDEPDEIFTLSFGALSGPADASGTHAVTILDDDSAGITLTGDGGAAVSEAGDTHAYTLALNSQPSAAVTITLTFGGQITVNGSASPLVLTFTDMTPQTLTVAALNDSSVEGPHSAAISYAVISADSNYHAFSLADSVVAIADNDAASITFGSPSGSISEASTPYIVNAVLTITSDPAGGALAVPVTVAILQTPDSATTPDDYMLNTTSLSFPANSVSGAVQPISVSITNDALDEPDEIFTLSFGALSGPADASGTHAVTILDDDSAGITLTGDGGAAVSEAGDTHAYTLALNSQPSAAVTITLTFDGQITVNGSASPLILTFADMTPQTLTVAAVNDAQVEGPHSAAISYAVTSADSNYHAFSLAASVVTITDNDAASITFGSPSGSVSEASTPYIVNAVLTITSDPVGGTLALPVTVALIHTPDSAATPDDYLLTAASLSFSANSVSGAVQPISVSITDDALDESDETFTLSFGALTGPADASGTHAVTILDDDSAGITLTGDGGAAVGEAGDTHAYTLALNSQPSAAVTVTLTFDGQITVNGSASPLVLTFADLTPQTVTVAAVNDAQVEGPHSAAISYAVISADSNYHGFSLADSVVAIADNDAASITFGSPSGSVSEASTPYLQNAVLTITSDPVGGTLAQPVTVAILQTPDTAATPDDYLLTTTSLSFPANSVSGAVQPISVSITDDALDESDETFTLSFGALNGPADASGAHAVTILDDDQPVDPPGNLLQNPGFEVQGGGITNAADWLGGPLTYKDSRICDSDTKTFAYQGDCAFRFQYNGLLVASRAIHQTLDNPARGLKGEHYTLDAMLSARDLMDGTKLILKIKYQNGETAKAMLMVPSGDYAYTAFGISLPIEHKVAWVRVVIRGGSVTGRLLIDDLVLWVMSDARGTADPLPLPPAPDGFKGGN